MKAQPFRFTFREECHQENAILNTAHSSSSGRKSLLELFIHSLPLTHMKQPRRSTHLARLSAPLFRCTLVVLMGIAVFGLVDLAHALPVSERTPQVRDEIVAAVPGVDAAADVTEAHLAAITELNLSSKGITSLKSDDFDGLTALTNLNLSDNNLTNLPEDVFDGLSSLTTLDLSSNGFRINPYSNGWSTFPAGVFSGLSSLTTLKLHNNLLGWLPVGIFDGLSSLTTLNLSGNILDPLRLVVDLERVATGQFKAVTSQGAPFNLVLPVNVNNGTIDGGVTSITIPAGHRESDTLTVTRNPGAYAFGNVSVAIGTLPELPPNHHGYTLRKRITGALVIDDITLPGNRTRQVREAIFEAIRIKFGISDYRQMTKEHLESITYLSLWLHSITSLKSGDFSGLSSLTTLNLIANALTSLPEGVFSGLSSLTTLNLRYNDLTSLPEGVFSGLSSLTTLWLDNNDLTSLPEGVFSGLSSLTTLYLTDNDLTSLPEGVFSGLSSLTTLYLTDNDLTSLPEGVFSGLSSLTTLYLTDNDLTSLPEGVFSGLSSLTTLYLTDNDLTSLPEGVFSGLSSLTTLYLTDNDLTSLPEGVFSGLSSLTTLYLTDNDLTSLPEGVFSGLSSLTTLYLSGNDLTSLPEGVFRGLSSLTALNLRDNAVDPLPLTVSLEKVSDGQFKAVAPAGAPFEMVLPLTVTNGSISGGATTITIPAGSVESKVLTVTRTPDTTGAVTVNIRSLPSNRSGYAFVKSADLPLYALPGVSLIGNRTQQVKDAIVLQSGVSSEIDVTEAHLTAITALNLQQKSITSLKAGDFSGLSSLTTLDLTDNELTSLPEGVFSGLSALTRLSLEYNALTSLPEGVFRGLSALTWLSLGANELTSLPEGVFSGLSALTTLDLGYNELTSLPEGVFSGLSSLTTLYLRHNELTSLPEGVFSGLSSLTTLDLRYNELTSLPEGVFSGLSALSWLYLNNNELTSLPEGVFSGLSALSWLYLSSNDLTSLPEGVFSGLSALSWLYLSSNDLTSLPEGVFRGLSALTRLKLDNNAVAPLPLTVSLEKVSDGQFKAVAPAGAPFEMVLPLTVTNGSISGGATTITIPKGSVESEVLTVTRTPDTMGAVTVNIGKLPRPPHNHSGYSLVKSADLPLEVIGTGTTPTVTTPTDTARSVNIPDPNLRAKIEDALGKASGDPITATEMATLTSLNAQDSSISDLTGLETATNLTTLKLGNNSVSDISALAGLTSLTELQLWDNPFSNLSILASLTNLTKLYIWRNGISDISVLAGLTSLTQLKINENTISNISILSRLTNLTELSLKDNAISDISALAGLTNLTELQIGNNTITNITPVQNLTKLVWLDMPNNSISDISVVQNLTKLAELYFQNNAVSDLSPLVANTGFGEFTELNASGNPLNYPSIYTHIPALQAKNVYIEFDNRVATTPVKISGDTQSGNTGTTLAQPFVVEVQDASRVAFAGVPVTFAVTAGGGTLSATNTTTDTNGRAESTLTLGNSAGTNTVRVSVTGITQTTTFTATATTTNTAPVFTDGTSTTRTISENTAAGVNIGAAIAATDADNDTLTYTLGGTDAASFSINSSTGQLQTKAALDYETKTTYTVTVTVSDGSLTDTITVTINVNDVADTPVVSTLTPVCDRTPQVRDAIVAAVPGVSDCSNVTETHIAAIRDLLDLRDKNISALKPGDFEGLSSLQELRLESNQLRALPADIFSGLSSLRRLYLGNNQLTSLPPDVFSGLTALHDLHLHNNQLTSLPVDLFAGLSSLRQINLHTNRLTNLPVDIFSSLSSLTQLFLRNNKLTSLPADLFSGLSSLQYLYLDGNRLTSLPADLFSELPSLTQLFLNKNQMSTLSVGMFRGLTASTQLWLQGNRVDPLPLTISLEKVGGNQFKATVPAGAPFAIVLPLRVANGAISGGANTLTIPQGSVESGRLTVTRTAGTTAAVTVDIGTLPGLPTNHQGYQLTRSANLPLEIFSSAANRAPTFTEGASTTRAVAENTAPGVNIGAAIAATDADNDALTYTLSGTDAASFSINSSTGQLQTKAALDYETKTTYTVTVTVSDGSLTDTITVTINVTDVDEAHTDIGVCKVGDILAPGESCTYPGTDATFSVLDNGQAQWNIPNLPPLLQWINQTSISGSLSISTTINGETYHFVTEEVSNDSWEIKEIGEDRPEQPETPEQPEQPGDTGETPTLSVTSTSTLTEATLHGGIITLNLSGGTYESTAVAIRRSLTVSGITGADFETFSVVRVSDTQATVELEFDGNISTSGTLTFNLESDAIANYDGAALTTQISVPVVTESVAVSTAAPLTEATLDESVVTLTLSGRNYESSGVRIRNAVTVSGISGVTVGTFDIERVNDTQVTVELTFNGNLNTDGTLTFTVEAGAIAGYDGTALTAQLAVSATTETPTVTDPQPPQQPDTTDSRVTFESTTPAGYTRVTLRKTGTVYGVPTQYTTDSNVATVAYMLLAQLKGCSFANAEVDRQSKVYIKTQSLGRLSNFASETVCGKTSRTWTSSWNGARITHLRFFDEGSTPNIQEAVYNDTTGQIEIPGTSVQTPTPTPTNTAPTFTAGSTTTRSVAENTAAGRNIGSPVSATDAQNDTPTYTLGGTDANAFSIERTTGQLKTKSALDYETKRTYTVTITVSDGSLSDTITVTISITDVAETPTPQQPQQPDTTDSRVTFESTTPAGYTRVTLRKTGTVYGVPTQYTTDSNVATVAYMLLATLKGCSFADAEVGRQSKVYIKTQALGSLSNFASETVCGKTSRTWTSSWNGARITHLRFFDESSTPNIKEAVYNDTTGQIEIPGESVQTPTTTPTPTNNAPTFIAGSSTTRSVAENTASGVNIGVAIAATDTDNDTLTYTLSGTNAASFSINSSTGQLQTKSALDYETKRTYTVTITVSDGSLSDTITVTISITDVAETPTPQQPQQPDTTDSRVTFESTTPAGYTRVTLRKTGTVYGVPTQYTTDSNVATVAYMLLAQLKGCSFANAEVDRQSKVYIKTQSLGRLSNFASETVCGKTSRTWTSSWNGARITHLRFFDESSTSNIKEAVYNDATGQIEIPGDSVQTPTPTPTPTNTAPTFTAGSTTTRTIAENTTAGRNIGSPVSATDADNDTLTYTFSSTDANAFSIERTTGQLKTRAALDYETKRSYTVTITVSDGSLSDTITVTINITDISEVPTTTVGQPEVCQVGDVLAPGESCTYPGTDTEFSVLNDGRGQFGFFTSGNGLNINNTVINGQSYTLVAQKLTSGSWEIEEIGDSSAQQSDPPQRPPGDGGGTPTLRASTGAPLAEATLDESVITLTLSDGTYESSSSRIRNAVTVSTGITGVTVRSFDIDRVSNTQITVELTFDGTDFDTNSTITFTVGAGAIADYDGTALTAQIPVTASTESVVASTTSPLTENTLDGSVVTLTLSSRAYETSGVRIRNAVTVSGISGVTVGTFDIDRVSDTQATVELTFNGNISTDSTLTFTVGAGAIAGYEGAALTTQLSVSASTEAPTVADVQTPDPPQQPEQPQQPGGGGGTPTLSASTADPLTEAALHEGVVTLTLGGGTYERSRFTIGDALTISGIDGVTIPWNQPERKSDTQITVELEFNGNINTNSTLTFTVGADAIVDYNGPSLTTQITVTASAESVAASTTAPLTETTLNESIATLTLNGAKYAESIFDIRDAVTVSGIAGVTKPWNQPERKSDTEVTVELEFDGTDFDTSSTLTFAVGADAIAGYNGPPLTAQISVSAVTELVVASTTTPLTEATLNESIVTLTLSGRNYAGSIWDIRGAVTVSGINGVTMPWNQPDRESDTKITIELEFDGNMDTDATLTFTVEADAIEGYNGPALTAQITVTATEQVLRAPSGISLMHVPLQVTAVDGIAQTIESVGDLYNALGGMNTVNLLITHNPKTQEWHSYLGESSRGTSADTILTDNQGIIADMKAPVSLHLGGDALGSNGSSFITLHPGTNLVGVPLKDPRITRVSDLFALEGIGGNVSAITVTQNETFQTVEQAGDAGDIPITGGQSFILNAWEETTVAVSGQGWDNVSGRAAAAPVALTGIQVMDTTPILALRGSIVSPVGEWNRMPHLRSGSGFRVIVKNLSTRKSVATMTGDEGGRYQLTVVDTEAGRAAQIGDILEISVRSPDPRIGVQPLRHTVTAEDVKWSRVELGNLIVYEIPTETELLPNYPNPFNPETWIPYRLAEDAFVTLTIYDLSGRVVRTLDVGHQVAAVYESRSKAVYWDGRNEVGERVASGVYFYHLSADNYSATRKMVILK